MADVAARGMSSSAQSSDGAFSPETSQVNLSAVAGVLYSPAGMTDKSTNLTGEAIAYCPTNVASTNGFILATDGKILSIDSSQALTPSSALSGTFTTGTSDIANFIDKIYATNTTDVCQMATNLTGGITTWWSATLGKGVLTSGVRHPLLEFQDRLWIGDNNKLHNIVDSSTGNAAVLTLTTHHEITALGVDQSSGKMLIATTQGSNYSGTIASGNSICTYDGTSPTYTREFAVDGPVWGFRNVGGITTYVFYGAGKIGYWNGAGVTFLRKLKNVTLAGADLPYKHHSTNIENTLYVVDGNQVLAYGEVLAGRKIWYYANKNSVGAIPKYSLICHVGSGKLGLGFTTTKFYTFDTTDVTTSIGTTFYPDRIRFPRPVFLRSLFFEYADAIPAADANRDIAVMTNPTDGFIQLKDPTNSFSALKNISANSEYEIGPVSGFTDSKVTLCQLAYTIGTTNSGLRRIILYFDYAE